jgi:hypothetical protein
MTTPNQIDELNASQIRLDAALRRQAELEQLEIDLAATRKTLAASKQDTEALKNQVRAALEESVRVQIERMDHGTRVEEARQAQAAAAALAARTEKAKEIAAKLIEINNAAAAADAAITEYRNKLVQIRTLQNEVSSSIRLHIITETWQTAPPPSIERQTCEGYNLAEHLHKNNTDFAATGGTSIITSSVSGFINNARDFITGLVK